VLDWLESHKFLKKRMFQKFATVVRPQQGASWRLAARPAARFSSLPATKFREEAKKLIDINLLPAQAYHTCGKIPTALDSRHEQSSNP
jgi:hypothetical protein